MKTIAKRLFHRLMDGYLAGRALDIDLQRNLMATRSTARYIERYAQGAEVFRNRTDLLRRAAALAKNRPGLVCEFGVFRGDSINLLAHCLPERAIFGFDSFEGLPAGWRTGYSKGSFTTNGALPPVRRNVKLIKGWFSETLGPFLAQHAGPMALVHIDCDIYESTKTILDAVGERIQAGTVLVFDEYFNYPGWRSHEYKAFQEFVAAARMRYEYVAYNAMHQQVIVRCTGSSQ